MELSGDIQAPLSYVSKADLWCISTLRSSLNFSNEEKSVELYGALENCELRLTEFYYGGTYTIGNEYSPGVYEFELRDQIDNRLIDKKLVRAIQPIEGVQSASCKQDCEFNEVTVVFPHSVLDIRNEVLINDVDFNELAVNLQEEPAPACDSLNARFIEGSDFLTPPSLEIKLENCQNTIGTGDLEFGFGPTTLNR